MKVALLGPSGYVGTEFSSQITKRGDEVIPIRRDHCDIYNVKALVAMLRHVRPDILLNCAGYTGKPNVDACELDKANCLAGNSVLPGVVAEACESVDLPWGHVSSGCIFSGRRADGNGFTEDDVPNFSFRQNNCSFYSGTKALGEEVLSEAKRCYIWRLRIPFSNIDSSRNYLSKLMRYQRLLEAENSLSYLPEFVTACLDCFSLKIPYGTYNVTNPGSVTTGKVAAMIQGSGICDKQFEFFESESEFMQMAAKTPRSNCIMDSTKAVQAGLKLQPVEDAIREALSNWVPEQCKHKSQSLNGS